MGTALSDAIVKFPKPRSPKLFNKLPDTLQKSEMLNLK